MKTISKNDDKAGVEYWDRTDRNVTKEGSAFSPLPGIRGFGRRSWHVFFQESLGQYSNQGADLLELGCGGSAFLPYFARRFGFSVSGIDYSKNGIETERQICESHDVDCTLYCSDIFSPPQECLGRFDVVVSFGVLEHFTDTESTLRSFSNFLRPGGRLLTVVPNMKGLCGFGQKLIAPDIYSIHETLDIERIKTAHLGAGLDLDYVKYFLFSNFGVINPGSNSDPIRWVLFHGLRAVTAISWCAESIFGQFPANRWTSPYLISIATKPMN